MKTQMKNIFIAISIATSIFSCGLINPSDDKQEEGAEDTSGEKDNNDAASTAGRDVEEKHTIKLTHNKKFDFILLRENSSRLTETNPSNNNTYRYDPFISKLYGGEEIVTPRLYDTLLVKLYSTDLDIKMGVIDAMHTNATADTLGTLVADEEGENFTFDSTKPSFAVDARLRVNHRTSQTFTQDNNFFPLQSLQKFLEKNDLPNTDESPNPTSGFLRDGAKFVVLYTYFMDDTNDDFNPASVQRELDSKLGDGNWKLSIAGIPAEGCTWKIDPDNSNEDEKHTNADQSAANIPDSQTEDRMDEITSYVRRDKMKNLMEQSGGVFMSLCDGDPNAFADEFIGNAMIPTYYEIKTKEKADFDSIKIELSNGEIKEFEYDPSTLTLKFKTALVKNDEKLTIRYKTALDGSKKSKSEDSGDSVTDLGERILTPAEQAYLTEGVKDAIDQNCTGCHQNLFGDFDDVMENKDQAYLRITDAANPMPPNDAAFMDSEEGQLILNWINDY